MMFLGGVNVKTLAALKCSTSSDDNPAGAAADAYALGQILDMAPFTHVGGRQVKALAIAIPGGADTDETVTIKVQESATTVSSDFSDITSGAFDSFAQEAADASNAFKELDIPISKRYVRAYATLAGTTPAFYVAAGLVVVPRETT